MAKIPLPERGQPLDVTYIYQMAEAINTLSTQISSATANTTTVNIPLVGEQTLKTSEAKIVATYKQITSTDVKSGNTEAFSCNFSAFKYPPIVSATVVNTDATTAGKDVTVVVTSVTTSRVDGFVRFGTDGKLSVVVHLVLVGVPN